MKAMYNQHTRYGETMYSTEVNCVCVCERKCLHCSSWADRSNSCSQKVSKMTPVCSTRRLRGKLTATCLLQRKTFLELEQNKVSCETGENNESFGLSLLLLDSMFLLQVSFLSLRYSSRNKKTAILYRYIPTPVSESTTSQDTLSATVHNILGHFVRYCAQHLRTLCQPLCTTPCHDRLSHTKPSITCHQQYQNVAMKIS